jgi:hypothetical protein
LAQVSGMSWPVVVVAASWCGPVPGAAVGRPPAVAVIGLRRSGRVGNGESPCGCMARRQAWTHRFTPDAGARWRAQDDPCRHGRGALRAPLMLVKKLLTPRRASARCVSYLVL